LVSRYAYLHVFVPLWVVIGSLPFQVVIVAALQRHASVAFFNRARNVR